MENHGFRENVKYKDIKRKNQIAENFLFIKFVNESSRVHVAISLLMSTCPNAKDDALLHFVHLLHSSFLFLFCLTGNLRLFYVAS